MRRLLYVTALVTLTLCASSAMAGQAVKGSPEGTWNASAGPPKSCDLQGTWIGDLDPIAGGGRFLSSYHGRTRISGTTDLEFLGLPPDVFGAASLTQTKGTWQRTGPKTYDYTMVTFGLDVAGAPIYRVVNSGTKHLSDDCDAMTLESYLQYFTPDGEPITECIGPFFATAERVEVAPACVP